MKIKQSFVTNSSSSSFVVIWDRKLEPKDINYINDRVMFMEKAQQVLKDSVDQSPFFIESLKDVTTILRKLMNYYGKMDYKSLEDGKSEIKDLLKKSVGKYVYVYSYCDENSRFFSEMEHGGTFDELPNVRVSHH